MLQGVAKSSGVIQCRESDESVLKRGQSASKNSELGHVNLAIICRKSCLNPGTRYNARGLNDKSSPGNEYEAEQILWRSYEGNIMFSTYVWRRGTVPIHWYVSNRLFF